jgi:hypothetical protein
MFEANNNPYTLVEKEVIGFSSGFCLNLGCMTGSIIAVIIRKNFN